MTDSTSLKVFKCPSCGGPLEPDRYASTTKCPYCGASVINPTTSNPTSTGTLSDVSRLAKEGKLDEAARIYSKITGLSHENAMFSVKSMAGVRDDDPPASAGANTYNAPQARPSYQMPPQPQPVYSPQPVVRARGGSCLSGVIRLVVILSILGTAFPAILGALKFQLPFDLPFLSGENPLIPEPFAKEVMSFSPSSLKDPRAIQVDGNGNILLFNYNSSEVQMFDPQGNEVFIMEITNSNGSRLYNDTMGVSRNGTIYIPGSDGIMVFNESGEKLSEITDDENLFIISNLKVGADDKLYARSNTGIVRFNEIGEIDLIIKNETIEEISGEYPSSDSMGVDAQGNIYFSQTFNKQVLKFSPTGEFLGSFSGDFDSVGEIAFDSYGRIYVVDFFDIKVFDANFNPVTTIDGSFWGVDFDSQGFMYAVTTQSDNVLKYEIRKPNTP